MHGRLIEAPETQSLPFPNLRPYYLTHHTGITLGVLNYSLCDVPVTS